MDTRGGCSVLVGNDSGHLSGSAPAPATPHQRMCSFPYVSVCRARTHGTVSVERGKMLTSEKSKNGYKQTACTVLTNFR